MIKVEKKYLLFLGAVTLAIFGLYFVFQGIAPPQQNEIRDFDEARDLKPISAIMEQNRFWLSTRTVYNPEQILLERMPYNDPNRKGQLKIKVIMAEGKSAGFVAYFKETSEEGVILFVAVDKAFRGRGLGKDLVKAAIAELKKARAQYVTLVTRTINEPAIVLYKSLGFQQVSEEDGIVHFILKNP